MLIFICMVFSGQVLQSQEVKNIFDSQVEATWYGLDFSKIKLIGSDAFTNASNIKNKFFPSWNNLILDESAKYDLKLIFHKDEVSFDLSIVEKRNKLPEADELVIDHEDYTLDKKIIEGIIKEYDTEAKEGIGIVFIMESFNKPENLGTMWVTYFDIATKNVLLTEKMSGKAGGIGLRNFWAKTYYNVMLEIRKKKFKTWKKEYN